MKEKIFRKIALFAAVVLFFTLCFSFFHFHKETCNAAGHREDCAICSYSSIVSSSAISAVFVLLVQSIVIGLVFTAYIIVVSVPHFTFSGLSPPLTFV